MSILPFESSDQEAVTRGTALGRTTSDQANPANRGPPSLPETARTAIVPNSISPTRSSRADDKDKNSKSSDFPATRGPIAERETARTAVMPEKVSPQAPQATKKPVENKEKNDKGNEKAKKN
jgi:hypothetical protein